MTAFCLANQALSASVKLGLFKNRQLIVVMAEELDAQPDSFHGFEGYTFDRTPKSYVPCTPGDIFSEAVLIYGPIRPAAHLRSHLRHLCAGGGRYARMAAGRLPLRCAPFRLGV
ncbi:MAG: hypothetical protein V8R27_00160 [Oscillospiraceae bacterium]